MERIIYFPSILILSFILGALADGNGYLLLYRPRDVSNECAFSSTLRYDISFGMGLSDTLTLVFRTLSGGDYECTVDIVTESWATIVVVVKYPTTLKVNCDANKDAIIVLKKNICLRLCDHLGARNEISPYYVGTVRGRLRFRFLSNSSINSDLNANLYQVTVTSARKTPDKKKCTPRNETVCIVNDEHYCFTSGVVCDGINNCGVSDWFDEKKAICGLYVETLGLGPVVAVIAAVFCLVLAGGHILLRCLPQVANSFFIYNANEDNRLCIDPTFTTPNQRPPSIEKVKRTSLIPASLSSSSISLSSNKDNKDTQLPVESLQIVSKEDCPISTQDDKTGKLTAEMILGEFMSCPRRNTSKIRSMAEKLQNKFRKEKKADPDSEMG